MRSTLVVLTVTLLLPCLCLGGRVTVKRDGHLITMSNEDLTVTVDLQAGGRVREYRYAGFDNKDIIYAVENRANGGLFLDHFSSQKWPGEFIYEPYEGEILEAGPDVGAVKVWRMSTGRFDGPVNQSLTEIKMQRTMTMRADSRVLRCRVHAENTGRTGKRMSYWQQNNFAFIPEKRLGNTWYRPAVKGIDVIDRSNPTGSHGYWYFVEPPVAGWTGVANREMGRGVMLLMDYNDLWKLYDNVGAATAEWMYDQVAIPPGKAWETDVYVIPTPGLGSYVHGSEEIIADMHVEKRDGEMTITHLLTQSLQPLTGVSIKSTVRGVSESWEVEAPVARLERVSEEVSEAVVTARGVKGLPAVVHVTVTGKRPDGRQVSVRYGDFLAGEKGENLDLVTMAPLYSFPRAPKKKRYLKPEEIVLHRQERPHVYFGRGVWYDFTRVDEALGRISEVEVEDGYYRASDVSNSLTPFPAGYDEMLAYDVVVLCNVDGRAMGGDVTEEMLADFVLAGGGLLYLAGDLSYGVAGHVNERFRAILPFELEDRPWGRIEGGAKLTVAEGAAEVLGDLEFDGGTALYYQHFQEAKPGAQVLITAGGRPILAAWERGKGRVAACVALPFGEAPAGQKAYWDAEQWTAAMERVLKWLLAR